MSCGSGDNDPEIPAPIPEPPNPNAETYFMVIAPGENGVLLLDREGQIVHDFEVTERLGMDANLQDDGSLILGAVSDNASIFIGGSGGKVVKQNLDGTIAWEVEFSSATQTSHHDVEVLSNGNIMVMVWERIPATEAQDNGFDGNFDIFPESIIEMNPETQQVVWEWHMMDHIVQDFDDTKANFGDVAASPHKIDINYNSASQLDGDLVHFNGLVVDEARDLIFITANFYNEVWVLDHSTTTTEAATGNGGNYGKGGDLVYRFGNPSTYDNAAGMTTLNRVHHPSILPNGNVMVFANQVNANQSEVIEFDLPNNLVLAPNTDNEPTIAWSYTHPELFSPITSGAVRMRNGNTLIAEGTDVTVWEVSPAGELVWQHKETTVGLFWRVYPFYADDAAIRAIGLE